MGALCTLLTYALLLVYGISLTQAFLDNSKQTESVQTLYYDRFKEGEFKFSDNSLKIMIITAGELDPAVGRIAMYKIIAANYIEGDTIEWFQTKEEVELTKCS